MNLPNLRPARLSTKHCALSFGSLNLGISHTQIGFFVFVWFGFSFFNFKHLNVQNLVCSILLVQQHQLDPGFKHNYFELM